MVEWQDYIQMIIKQEGDFITKEWSDAKKRINR